MGFSEELKVRIRKNAHHACCLCKSLGVEIHHIVPEKDGGPDTEDNAAPLCPSCHETYGGNPEKRKFLREARDFWYEICEKRFTADNNLLKEISELLKITSSKVKVKQGIESLVYINSPRKKALDGSWTGIHWYDNQRKKAKPIQFFLEAKDNIVSGHAIYHVSQGETKLLLKGGFCSDSIIKLDYKNSYEHKLHFGVFLLELNANSDSMSGAGIGYGRNPDEIFTSYIELQVAY